MAKVEAFQKTISSSKNILFMKSPLIVRTSPLNDRYFIDYSHSTVCLNNAVVLL